MFQKAIRDVRAHFEGIGLGYVFAGVRRISVVRQESYHDSRTWCIGLNPRDLRKPYAAFHRRPYLLIHELAHHFAEAWLTPRDRKKLIGVFGDYDRPYRRLPKPRRAGADHVSRYAATHPAEDFAETFAVCLWRSWEPREVARLMRGKSVACRRKMEAVERLLGSARTVAPPTAARRRTSGAPGPCSGPSGAFS